MWLTIVGNKQLSYADQLSALIPMQAFVVLSNPEEIQFIWRHISNTVSIGHAFKFINIILVYSRGILNG